MAFGEEIPDYNKPYSSIFTEKEVYTWTDKVKITIAAPSWNAHKNAIDSIGTEEEHFIKISTGNHFLEPYKLTETDLNTGIFVGEITLTGFNHDVDGDGSSDTNPQTAGTGPTNGFLESERDSAITISFEFADGVVLTHSVPISWNVGTIKFLQPQYVVGQNAIIRVIDPDLNLNPESIDQVKVEVSSDSDASGITVQAIETTESSGVFNAEISFSQNFASSGNRLFAIPGNTIYAKYADRTLPRPYSESDDLDVVAQTSFESDIPPMERITIENVFLADGRGIPLSNLGIEESFQTVGSIKNNQNYEQNFVYLIQISDDKKRIASLSWIKGNLAANQKLDLSQSWTPTQPGDYTIETFVWKSLNNPIPLSESSTLSITVQ